jgi:hypothetical protein
MALIRIAVDLNISEYPNTEDLMQFEKSLYQFVEGVASETLGYTVAEKSVFCQAHLHESSMNYSCEYCVNLSDDRKS